MRSRVSRRRRVRRLVSAAVVSVIATSAGATTPAPVTGTWLPDADGSWFDPSNWKGGTIPGAVSAIDPSTDDVALFNAVISLPRVVTLGGTATLGSLRFDAANAYSLVGTSTLTLQGAKQISGTSSSSIIVTATNGAALHVIDTPLQLSSTLNVSVAPSTGLELGGPVAFGSQAINVSGGGTLRLNVAAGSSGYLPLLNISGSTLEITNGNFANAIATTSATLNMNGGTIRLSDAAQFAGATHVTNGVTLDVPVGTATWTAGGGGDALTKIGAGTLRLSATYPPTFTTLTLNGGELIAPNSPFNASNIVLNHGTLASSGSGYISSKFLINGDVQLGDAAYPGTMSLGGTFTLGTNHSQYTLTTPSAANSVVFHDSFTDNGRGCGVTFAGPGTVLLEGATTVGSTYSGPAVVSGGTVLAQPGAVPGALVIGNAVGGPSATFKMLNIGAIDTYTDLTVNATGTLDFNDCPWSNVGSIAGSGTILFNRADISLTELTITGSNSTTFTGSITGSMGQVVKTGSGTLTLGGVSTFMGGTADFWADEYGGTYSGGFTISGGSLALASDTALGPDRLIINDASNTISISAVGGARTFTNGVSISHYATFAGSNAMSFGLLRLESGTKPVVLTVNADTTFNGPLLANPGESSLTKLGAGTLTLNLQRYSGINGPFNIYGGVVRFNSFPVTGGFSVFNLNNSVLDFTGAGTNVTTNASFAGTNGTVLGSLTLMSPASISGTGMSYGDLTFSPLAGTGPSQISGSITTGALNLDGAVRLSGTVGGAGAVLVNSTGTVTLLGTLNKPLTSYGHLITSGKNVTVGGPVTLTGGSASLSVGGTLHAGNVSMAGGVTFGPTFSGTNTETLAVTGSVDLGTDDLLLPTGTLATAATNAVYVVIDNDATDPVAGRFANVPDDGDTLTFHGKYADYTLAINYHYDTEGDLANNDVALTYLSSTPTPEPAAVTGLAFAGLAALARRRRRPGCPPRA